MATMYVGGGLYLPTTGTASKPKASAAASYGASSAARTPVAARPTVAAPRPSAAASYGASSAARTPTSTASMGTSRSITRPRNTAAQNAAVASLLSGAGTGGIDAVRRSANPVNVVGYRPPPLGSSTHGMIVNSPGNYPPTSFQSLQNAASSLAAIQAAQRERDARAAKTPQLFGGGYAPFVQPERVGTPPPPGVYPGSVAYNDWQSRLLQSGGVPQHFATPVTVPPMATKDEYAAGGKYADRNWYADTLGYGATQFRHGFGDLVGTPISALNSAATGLQNLAGVTNPDESYFFGGGEDIKRILDFGGVIPAVPARDRAQENLGLLAYLAGGAGLPMSVPGKAGAVLTVAGAAKPVNAPTKGLTLVHGSNNPALTLDDIQIIRSGGQKQGKPNRVYGGLYTHAEDDVKLAANYAKMGDGTPSLYNVQIKPGAKVEDFGTADVTRLKKERIDELVEQGVGVVKGQNPLGKTEWVVIDKNAIQDFAPRAAAGIDAAIPPTPRQVALRDLTPEQEYVRDFVETRGRLPPPNDDFFNPTSVRMFDDDKSALSDPLSGGSLAREQALSTPLEGIYPYPRVGASGGYDDMLYSSVEDALGLGPTVARAEQLAPPAATGGNPATGRNAYMDVIDAVEAEKAALAARSGELFPDMNPAATISDPMDVLRPVFMSADEAADITRPGPRVAADNKRMDPFIKKMLIGLTGAGVAIPGLAGLSLLANGQLTPAPPATTPPAPEPGGIDVAASGAPRSARALRQAQINQNAANLGMPAVPQLPGSPAATSDEQARLEQQVAAAKALQDELGIPTDPASFDPTAYPTVNSPGQVELVGEEDTQPVDRPAITTSTDKARYDELFETGGTGDTPLVAGKKPVSAAGGTSTPAAGTKFTPGPGQFVGTNGYIYEQSSDGSFENVGRVPGYTPAQLSEAANKGAFRDPNNIVTGGAKPRKQVKKKGEKNFIDKAGDILKERFDDSLFARLFLNQDDEAAPEAAATGPEAVEYYSTPPSSVPESLVSSSGSSKKRKKKDEDETDGGTGGTGTGGTGTGTYTPPTQAMIDALYAPYMRQYTGPGAGYVPGVNPEWRYFADGGLVDGRLVLGDGGPKEDKIPATIDGVEQAKLSNGEFVMTAAAVKNAGGGDIELGAKRLMDLNNMLSYGRPAERLKVQHVK